ncbi:LysR family transcriptional regulator [Tissierella sp. MB52-C2]|uniref:LysR family transcriptional regulator n=1 Tax=Tissierella sp. MB52-C2 TaxID=3070999 RepID=UPI00280B235F|nr:LysR family transcriptional regulator [Tissierella sp. MB52-C2]WMM26100.1 LysR family transcriptional regulator [Tissierella sp. MB52-C2]
MTITKIEVFLKVVELGSFTKAAKVLNMTQSAVSHAINGLEKDLKSILLIRDKKEGIILTEVGQKLLGPMRNLIGQVENIKFIVNSTNNLETGSIRIGSYASASSCLLPKILVEFEKKFPKIDLVFFEGNYDEIIEWLEIGIVDVGFVIETDRKLNLQRVPIIKDKLVVGFYKGHKFEDKENINIKELKDEIFILPKGPYRKQIDMFFHKNSIVANTRFDVHDCNTISNMVESGLGITIGSELFLKTQSNILTANLTNTITRDVYLACSSFSSTLSVVEQFVKVSKDVFPM